MSKNNKNKKILAMISALSLIVLQTIPLGVGAATATSALSYASSIEFPTEDDVNDQLGYVDKKTTGPIVKLYFSSDNGFDSGTDVTANAVPGDFQTDTGDLYFTWYLKKEGCGLTKNWYITKGNNQPKKEKSSCDLDGDELVTPNDWKIAATRAVIKRKVGNFSASGSGIKAEPSVTNKSAGWVKNFLRNGNGDLKEENDESAPNCYFQNSESGLTYELRRTEVSFDSCPSGYMPSCTKTSTATCDVLNPNWTQININEAGDQIAAVNVLFQNGDSVVSTDYNSPLFNQEEIAAVVADNAANMGEAGYPKLLNYDDHVLPQKTITGSANVCAVSTSGDLENVFNCEINSNIDDYETSLSCEDGGVPVCLQSGTATTLTDASSTTSPAKILGKIFPKVSTENSENASMGICQVFDSNTNAAPLDSPPSFLQTQNTWNSTTTKNSTNAINCSYLTDALVNGIKEDLTISPVTGVTSIGISIPQMTTVFEGNSALQPECSFTKGANLCKHLFPYFPEKNINTNNVSVDLSNDDMAGDGEFSENEKKFWGTDMADSGGKITDRDETLVTGKGLDEFTWLYAEGDKVGVAVEGDSYLGTDHSDSSFKRMWAFSNGTCEAIEEKSSDMDDAEEGENIRGFYTEEKTNILTADIDLDRCLEENLVDPTEDSDGIGKMTIGLTATPQNPTNNSSGGGDTLKVVAGVQNVDNLGSVYYKWTVEISEEGAVSPTDDTKWADITEKIIDHGSLKSSDTEGLGKSALNILLNLDDKLVDPNNEGAFYLKIKVKATEKGTSTYGYITVKVLNEKHKFAAHSVIAGADGKLSVDSQEICADAASRGICYVSENKIVGLNILDSDDLSGVSWTVNGKSMSCPGGLSSECSNGKMLIFPILGNPGEVIVVTASSVGSEGTSRLTRYFIIAEPQLKIVTTNTDNVWPKLMGFYKDTDGNKTADYSSETMETNYGNTVTLKADTAAAWGYFGQSFYWTLDGEPIDTSDGYLSFDVNKEDGYSYNVSAVMEEDYTEENVTKINYLRKALYQHWGVDSGSYDYGSLAASIQINVVGNAYETVSDSGKAGIFASLITNMPQQILFLIKFFSTSFLVLFVLGLIFAVTPESLFEKETKTTTN